MKKTFIFIFLFSPIFALAALININTAGIDELKNITGVGDAIANNIIIYRNTNGPFKKIEDIINVNRIGEVTFSKMEDQITVGSVDNDNGQFSNSETEETSGNSEGGNIVDSEQVDKGNNSGSFKISIGKERLATVRTPINFAVSTSKKGKFSNSFNWSFGDGTSATGPKVTHAYQYPGRYNVVLNSSIDETEEATARTIVLVVEAKLKITGIDPDQGYIEVTNSSDKEQNLNNWKLKLDSQTHTFPTDTIISPKSAIKIPVSYLGFNLSKTSEISLTYSDGGVVSKAVSREGSDQEQVVEMKNKLSNLKQQLALTSENKNLVSMRNSPPASNVITLKKELSWFEKIKHAIFE